MSEKNQKPWLTKESWRLAFVVACEIWKNRTEKEAVRGICEVLQIWNVKISPDELGKDVDCADKLWPMFQKEWH